MVLGSSTWFLTGMYGSGQFYVVLCSSMWFWAVRCGSRQFYVVLGSSMWIWAVLGGSMQFVVVLGHCPCCYSQHRQLYGDAARLAVWQCGERGCILECRSVCSHPRCGCVASMATFLSV